MLPIRQMTLYKHGVGFFQRQGAVEGQEAQLTFRREEVNDALKSLTAFTSGEGQVLSIDYQTPGDKQARFAANLFTISEDHSLLDLLRSLRGRLVRLKLSAVALPAGSGAAEQSLRPAGEEQQLSAVALPGGSGAAKHTEAPLQERSGVLIGVEVVEEHPLELSRVALLDAASATVETLPISRLQQVQLLDERAAQDLGFFLETSKSEETHCTVTVRLSQGATDLTAMYIAPSPTWRVSYRFLGETQAKQNEDAAVNEEAAGEDSAEQGEALLQGWGLFDNRLDEDLTDVQVTLVAGMPISFVYDLATSQIPTRPVVQDAARIVAGPVEFNAAVTWDAPEAEAFATPSGPQPAPPPPPMPMMAAPAGQFSVSSIAADRSQTGRKQSRAALEKSTASSAQGADLGELFGYSVTAPVSVKRGASVMAPIVSVRQPYQRVLLYNGQKMPRHPVVTARFKNGSGLTLERGPVTVIEDNDYRGEAVLPFTKTEGEIYLAYAVELGIVVREEYESSRAMAGLRVSGEYLIIQEYEDNRVSYTLENTAMSAQVVTIEREKVTGADIVETRAPDEETLEQRRWRVRCPARRTTTFVVVERSERSRYEQVLQQSYTQLQTYLKGRWLNVELHNRLVALLQLQAQIQQQHYETGQLEQERTQLYKRQDELRKNMGAVNTTREEATLRQRFFAQLTQSQDRLEEIDRNISTLKKSIADGQQQVQMELQRLAK